MTIADRKVARALREACDKIHEVLDAGGRPQLIDAADVARILGALADRIDPIPR